MKTTSIPTLGIDIGRVIIGAADPSGHADTSFLRGDERTALNTPATEGAFETIAELTELFHERVWLVSKCGPRIQSQTLRWLKRHDFFIKTGVHSNRVLFCRERHQKREHCAKIGATHFVDDRIDVHQHLRGQVPNLFWFGHQKPGHEDQPWLERVLDWGEARAAILRTFRAAAANSRAAHAR